MEDSILRKRLERERAARKQAEAILETKALELYKVNSQLLKLNETLEEEIALRTEELAYSELQYRSLVERSSDIFFNIDTTGKFLFINATGIHSYGFDEDEIIGHYFYEFVPVEFRNEIIAHYFEFMSSERNADYMELPMAKKNGDEFWIGQNVNRLKDDEGVPYFSGVARDITNRIGIERELKKAEGALIKSEVKYRSVIENMRLGLLEVDTEGTIIKSYDRFNEMLGYQTGELEGKSANKILTAEGFDEVITAQDRNRLKGDSGVYEMKLKKKNGDDIWMLISGTPFYNEKGEIVGSVGIHYDITAEKKLTTELEIAREAAERAQKAEKQFLANMSHEIRTPLNAIIGMSHLVGDTKLDEEQSEYVDILKSSARNLKNLISDILDMSKIDAGTLTLQEKEFDVEHDVKALVKSFLHKSKDKNVVYSYAIDSNIKCQIITDRQLINQILLNLYSNADKFTEDGSVTLTVDLIQETADTYTLKFSVKDTGIGIAEKEASEIFEEFKQASQEIRSKYGGTGLGLSISKKLLNLMGSEIQLDSIVGKGSDFYFEINVRKGQPLENQDASIVKMDLSKFQNQSKKILVVEDNRLNVKYLTRLLEKWGLEYFVKSNGQEAVDYCEDNFIDLILMDLQMPILDGFEATKIIRKMKGRISEVPIIALTASTFLSKKQMSEQVGMTDFLSKPFTPDQLYELLRKYIIEEDIALLSAISFQYNEKLDTKYLIDAYGEDTEYAKDIFETFIEIIESELETLKNVIPIINDDLKHHLHKIKPIFTMVGLSHISKEVEKMEKSARQNDKVSLIKEYDTFLKALQDSLPIIVNELDRLKEVG